MWEDWVEWMDYAMIAGAAYGVAGLARRPDGFIGLADVPDGLNHWLLRFSRFYEFLVLRFAEEVPRPPVHEDVARFVRERLWKVPALANSVGAKLVLYPSPPLDRPFAETAASPPEWHRAIVDYGKRAGVTVVPLQDKLRRQDYLALRMDPCCHFNAEGHRALVPVMERIVLRELERGD
jgi:hypothetical protein